MRGILTLLLMLATVGSLVAGCGSMPPSAQIEPAENDDSTPEALGSMTAQPAWIWMATNRVTPVMRLVGRALPLSSFSLP